MKNSGEMNNYLAMAIVILSERSDMEELSEDSTSVRFFALLRMTFSPLDS